MSAQPLPISVLMDQRFRGNSRSYGTITSLRADEQSGKLKGNASTVHEPVTEVLWQRHLDGDQMIGIAPLDENGMCRWGTGDVDDYKNLDHFTLARKIGASRWPAILNVSKSGGVHINLFASVPVPGKLMQRAVEAMMADLGYPVPPNEGFPKGSQWEFGPTKTPGNYVFAPYFNVKGMCNTFAYGQTGQRLLLEEFLRLADKMAQPLSFFQNLDLPKTPAPRPAKAATHKADRERRPMDYWLDRGIERIKEQGQRNEAGNWTIQQLRDEGYDRVEIEGSGFLTRFVQAANNACHTTPLYTLGEIRATLKSVFKREARDPVPEREAKPTREGCLLAVEAAIREKYILAADVAARVHYYDETRGTYVFDEHEKFFQILKSVLAKHGHMMSTHDQKTLLANLALDTPKLWPEPPQHVINCRNGLVDIRTGEVIKHTKDHLWAPQLAVDFDPSATCPKVDAFLNDILHPDEVTFMFELIGCLLFPDMDMQKAFLFWGKGSNGKSQLIELIRYLVGAMNCSAASLEDIEGNRFTTVQMVGKLVNIEEDLTSPRIPGSGRFKAITGGGVVQVEQKFVQPREVRLFVRMIISCNHFPRSGDNSNAWWRRWLVVPFNKRNFEADDAEARIVPKKLLPPLKAEASGMLNRSLAAYAAVCDRGHFTESKGMLEAKTEFKRSTDNLSAWLDEFTIAGVTCEVAQRELRNKYNQFCREKGYGEMQEREFAERVVEFRPKIKFKTIRGDISYFTGIGLLANDHEQDWDGASRYCASKPPDPVQETLIGAEGTAF
jgi:putative DNA primase/helicase